MHAVARAIVRFSARVVPAHYRDRWREEWLAELAADPSKSSAGLVLRSLGAPIDALSSHWTVAPDTRSFTIPRPTRSDVVLALRQIQQTPLLSAAAVVALAVGIGATVFVFTFVTSAFYGTLPVRDSRRVVKVHDFDRVGRWGLLLDRAEFDRRRQAVSSFEGLAAYNERTAIVAAPGRSPELVGASYVTTNLGQVLRVTPSVGRDFSESDEQAPRVALISDGLYERFFDRDPAVIGREVRLDERAYEIVGVMPPRWRFPMRGDVWVPLDSTPHGGASPQSSLHVIGRLAAGVDVRTATAEMQAVAQPWTRAPGREHVSQTVMGFTESTADRQVRMAVWAVILALVLLLCVSAGNVANVVLARALARRREMAVRSALGASRARLVMQVTIEAAVLSGIAALLGALAADAGLRWMEALEIDAPFWVVFHLDGRALLFVIVLAMLATAVAGLGPALRATRGSMFAALRESGATLRFGRLSGMLIVGETALSIALLTGAFLLARSLSGFVEHDARLPASQVLVAQLYFGQAPALAGTNAPTDPERRREATRAFLKLVGAQQRRLVEQLSSEPGVRAISLGSRFPGDEPETIAVDLRQPGAEGSASTHPVYVDEAYLDLLQIKTTAGRFVSRQDVIASRAVAIVNEPFVRKHFAGRNPLGMLLRLRPRSTVRVARIDEPWREIVGVVPDLGINPGNPEHADAVYLPLAADTVVRVGVATNGHPVSLVPVVHRMALGLDPRPQVQWTTTLDEQMKAAMTALRAVGLALVALGGVALLLSCLGTYAIVAFSVAQLRRDIAIRVAMGAGPRQIISAVFAPSVGRLALGTLLGGVLGLGVERLVALVPFALAETSLWSNVAMVVLVTITGALACAGPLRRALSLRPAEWLNQ